EGAERLAMRVDVAQVERAEVDALHPEQLCAPARVLLLALGERGRHHFVAAARRVDAEGPVAAAGVEGPHPPLAQVAPEPEPPIEHARVAVDEQGLPAE